MKDKLIDFDKVRAAAKIPGANQLLVDAITEAIQEYNRQLKSHAMFTQDYCTDASSALCPLPHTKDDSHE